jgi:hypothetical protein
MYKIIGADQKEYGPISADQMRQWLAEGRVNGQTQVQAEGQADWRPLSSYPEFAVAAQAIPTGAPFGAVPSANAAALVSGPATGLLITGIICAITAVLSLLSNAFGWGTQGFGQGGGDMPPQFEQWARMSAGPMGMFFNVVGIALSGLIIFASTKMRKLESYGLVMAATIIAMVPCISPCCCVGLPIGIWVLVVLNKPEVKSAFH